MLYENMFLAKMREKKLKPYQRLGARGLNRKKLNQVPEYAKGRGDLNPKVEMMRKGKMKRVLLTPSDITYIRNRYNIHDISDGKKLGSTGITIKQDPMSGNYMLTRDE